jgi:hypothetical protein
MRVESENVSQSSEVLSAAPIHLTFKQMLVQNQDPVVFAQAADSSLIDRGMAILSDAGDTVSSLAGRIGGIF